MGAIKFNRQFPSELLILPRKCSTKFFIFFTGQKATEDNAPIINVKCADDKILNCCLQLQHKSNDVILLTNDINLSNKALMNGIEAMTSKQFLDKFE